MLLRITFANRWMLLLVSCVFACAVHERNLQYDNATCSPACGDSEECFAGTCCASPPAGGSCSLPDCGCPGDQVCVPLSLTDGMSCVDSNGLGDGADCSSGGVCARGLGCFGGICSPYCNNDSDCSSIGGAKKCLPTTWSASDGGGQIPGVRVCARVCDPLNPRSPRSPLLACPAGFRCSPDETGASDCGRAGPGVLGSFCTFSSDCSPGLYCSVSHTCNQYCTVNSDCPAGTTCNAFSPAQLAGTYSVGWCSLTFGQALSQEFIIQCGKMRDCAPGWLSYLYGTFENCGTRSSTMANWLSALPCASPDIASVASCTDAWKSLTCSNYFTADPDVCWTAGKLLPGSPCNSGEQCDSMFCKLKEYGWSCGTCAPMPVAGATCANDYDCGRGLWCMADGTCQKPSNEGQSCSNTLSCRNDLNCIGGQCVTPPSTSGASCNNAGQQYCAFAQNLTCPASTNKCIPIVWAADGLSCPTTATQSTYCTEHGSCINSSCTSGPADHDTCDPANDLCEWPARCSTTSKTCVLPADVPTCK
jgi:hypothetical protein